MEENFKLHQEELEESTQIDNDNHKLTTKKTVQTIDQIESSSQNSVTISGPSHTAIVSVGTSDHQQQIFNENVQQKEIIKDNNNIKEIKIKEQQISVTKIQLKRETTSTATTRKPALDFLNVQLNKVETKPNANVVLTTPKIIDEQIKPKIIQQSEPSNDNSPTLECKRKFSAEDIEIIEKDSPENVSTAFITITTTPPVSSSTRMFKKHSETSSQQRKSSLVCESNNKKEKPILRAKSCSLEIETTNKSTTSEEDR